MNSEDPISEEQDRKEAQLLPYLEIYEDGRPYMTVGSFQKQLTEIDDPELRHRVAEALLQAEIELRLKDGKSIKRGELCELVPDMPDVVERVFPSRISRYVLEECDGCQWEFRRVRFNCPNKTNPPSGRLFRFSTFFWLPPFRAQSACPLALALSHGAPPRSRSTTAACRLRCEPFG